MCFNIAFSPLVSLSLAIFDLATLDVSYVTCQDIWVCQLEQTFFHQTFDCGLWNSTNSVIWTLSLNLTAQSQRDRIFRS